MLHSSERHICTTQVLRVSYWVGLFRGLISWEWQACQQPYGCWDERVQLCLYLTCLRWGLYGQSWRLLPASSSIIRLKEEQIVAVKPAHLPSTTQTLSKGPVFPLLQPERKFSSGTTLSSKCSKLFIRPTWPTLQHRELKVVRGIKVP